MKDRGPRNRNLISATDTILIIIECPPDAALVDSGGLDGEYANTVLRLVSSAKTFTVPVIAVAPSAEQEVGGAPSAAVIAAIGESNVIECLSLNPWDTDALRERLRDAGRSRLVVAGQSSEVSVSFVVLSALGEGYDVYVVKDASVGASQEHHDTAIERMVQAGAVPVTSRQIAFEWQRESLKTSKSLHTQPPKKERQKST
jgi:nicotinamidase-related amidase